MKKVWKDVQGYEGIYQASSTGEIKTLSRYINYNGIIRKRKEKILKPYVSSCGYAIVDLRKNNIRKKKTVHSIIAETFYNKKEGLVVNHKDKNKLNNNLYNLEYCTQSQNLASKVYNKKKTSIYRGVSICLWKKERQWTAQISCNRHIKRLGYFNTQEDAALAYNEKAKELFGKFALLNEVA